MLDLQKYLGKAATDPGFKAKLLKNANQAVKDEFGEDLPYKLKCKEKLVFEIEATNEMPDAYAKSVAGGSGVWVNPSSFIINDRGPQSTQRYRARYGFGSVPPIRPDSPMEVRNFAGGQHSPFVRSRDDSEIRKANFDGIGTAPYIYNRRDNI